MNTLIRLFCLLIYPTIVILLLFLLYSKEQYNNSIKKHYKEILINTTAFVFIVATALVIFFKFENTIYSYDYAGHWIRQLTLEKMFFENPAAIPSLVYESMNTNDYSYLPALFGMPLALLNESYGFFCLSNLVLFLAPTILVLNIVYFTYFEKLKFLPLFISIMIFPLYLTIFYGKVDCCGLFFIAVAYALCIFSDIKKLNAIDIIAVNACCFLAVFLRRWYLYSDICLYLALFINWLFSDRKAKGLFKIISCGLLFLVTVLIFFRTFLVNALTNNFSEAYAIYNYDGKLYSLINNISPLIILISLFGCYSLYRKDKSLLIICFVSIVVPCILIWRIQSFEFHHYYIFLLNINVLFTSGLTSLSDIKNPLLYILCALLCAQSVLVFTEAGNTMPVFTSIRKNPEVLYDKEEIIDLAYYLRSIEEDKTMTAYLAGGTYGIITDDLVRNALLPDLDGPSIDSAVLDLRDGFPRDFEYIRYVIVVDPMLYTNKDYQHIFDIIAYAVTEHPDISKVYEPIYSTKINDYDVVVYEKTGEITPVIKEYFYNEMIKFYPDKTDYFKYILDE